MCLAESGRGNRIVGFCDFFVKFCRKSGSFVASGLKWPVHEGKQKDLGSRGSGQALDTNAPDQSACHLQTSVVKYHLKEILIFSFASSSPAIFYRAASTGAIQRDSLKPLTSGGRRPAAACETLEHMSHPRSTDQTRAVQEHPIVLRMLSWNNCG